MVTSRIRILTHITARPHRELELRNLLLPLVAQRCRKVGCSRCDLLQHQMHSTHFVLVEEWEIEARLQSGLNPQDWAKVFEEGVGCIVELPSVNWYEIVAPSDNQGH